MIHRSKRITFRLTPEEEARYAPLANKGWRINWSQVIRIALREYWDKSQKAASDNLVRQSELDLSDTRSPVRQPKKTDTPKMRRRQKSRKK
jgi:Arc/MetJ-type ribon-helix-helix transcriptional regulator